MLDKLRMVVLLKEKSPQGFFGICHRGTEYALKNLPPPGFDFQSDRSVEGMI